MSRVSEIIAERHIPIADIAVRSGLTEERVKQVALGATASVAEVRSIAKALRLPAVSLLRSSDDERAKVLFRKMRASDGSPQAALIISQQVSELLGLIPERPNHLAISQLRDASGGMEPERLAEVTRDALGFNDQEPAQDLAARASELLGLAVCYSRDPTIEGASVVADGISFAFISARTFRPRVLFTLAHEIGHLIAHHCDVDSDPILDGEGDIGRIYDPRVPSEKYADQFASALLLPRRGTLEALVAIRKALGNPEGRLGDIEILYLARFFGVSFEVAARRCESLNLIPHGAAIGLYQTISDHHGNPEKRADAVGVWPREELEIRTSRWLVRLACERIRAGKMSIGRAAEILNVRKAEILGASHS